MIVIEFACRTNLSRRVSSLLGQGLSTPIRQRGPLDVEDNCEELLIQALWCHKEPAHLSVGYKEPAKGRKFPK